VGGPGTHCGGGCWGFGAVGVGGGSLGVRPGGRGGGKGSKIWVGRGERGELEADPRRCSKTKSGIPQGGAGGVAHNPV